MGEHADRINQDGADTDALYGGPPILLHGWYNACYEYAQRESLARHEWIHVDESGDALKRHRKGTQLILLFGWEFDVLADAEERGFEVIEGPQTGHGVQSP